VSPHARDQRSNQKPPAAPAQGEAEPRRNRQLLGIVLTLVVVAAVIGISYASHKDKSPVITQAAARSTEAPAASSRSALAAPVPGCVAPPPVPTDNRVRTLPNKRTAAGKTFIASVTTNCGVITMELDGTKAPQTVASFLGLAKTNYWVDSPCHRLTTAADGIFVLQCGDPTGTGDGTPGYSFGVENAPANSIYPAGTLAMARTQDPNSNGGQFFIVYKQTTISDPTGYSIFGKITSGMDIVDRIAAAGASLPDANQNTAPLQPISILAVNVTEKKA
jgi:peptidyl-prolyl cis-trans isomerase B (cyclophilin B)